MLAVVIAVLHVGAVVLGRRKAGPLQRAAFISGLLGIFSFPLLFFVGLKNICIAGGCGHGQDSGMSLVVVLFAALSVVSGVSVAALVGRRSHA